MRYVDIKIRTIVTPLDEHQAIKLLSEEFPDHEGTKLNKEYKWVLIAKKKNKVIGIITANPYIPKKALLCDITVDKKYRSSGVGVKLLKHMGMWLQQYGYTHLMGFTPKNCKSALSTYKRVHTDQQEMIVTTSDLSISVPHIEQIEMRLLLRGK